MAICAGCLLLSSERSLAQQQYDATTPWGLRPMPTSFGFHALGQETSKPSPNFSDPGCRDFRQPIAQLKNAIFRHGRLDHPQRHIDKGEPLVGTSWLNRPLHADIFVGGIWPGALIRDGIDQDSDLVGGYRFGRDIDHYWGWESRLGFANLPTINRRNNVGLEKDSSLWFLDAEMLYYPWGDATWRPYFAMGLGVANWRFNDASDVSYNEYLIQMPIGIGVKYHWRKWIAARIDLFDNISFGSGGIDTMHNMTLTVGVEVHFGGWRRSYYPWNPDRHLL